ncbi:MAG: hypothetical protein ACXVHB_19030 [Solirubrobacteraceae bacterium]
MLDHIPERVLENIKSQIPARPARRAAGDRARRALPLLRQPGYITGQVWGLNAGPDM